MIRIFYNSESGQIKTMANVEVALNVNNDPYIDIPSEIRINEWSVDLETKQLIPVVTPKIDITR